MLISDLLLRRNFQRLPLTLWCLPVAQTDDGNSAGFGKKGQDFLCLSDSRAFHYSSHLQECLYLTLNHLNPPLNLILIRLQHFICIFKNNCAIKTLKCHLSFIMETSTESNASYVQNFTCNALLNIDEQKAIIWFSFVSKGEESFPMTFAYCKNPARKPYLKQSETMKPSFNEAHNCASQVQLNSFKSYSIICMLADVILSIFYFSVTNYNGLLNLYPIFPSLKGEAEGSLHKRNVIHKIVKSIIKTRVQTAIKQKNIKHSS